MIVLDANILVRAVLGRRVRQLLDKYADEGVRFIAPDVAFDDAQRYLPSILEARGRPVTDVRAALSYLQEIVEPVEYDVYVVFEAEARQRLRGRNEEDWECWRQRWRCNVQFGLRTRISLAQE